MNKTRISLWKSGRLGTALAYAAGCLVLICIVLILGEELNRHIDTFETWIGGFGLWALAIFILLYVVLSSIFFPESILGIIAGTTFGFVQGLLAVAGGSFIAALLQYALARRLFKLAINRALESRPDLAAIQTAVLRQELRLQLLIRLTPLNRALINYMLGAAGVGLIRFVVACSAILPHVCLEVYFGYASKHLIKAARPEQTIFMHDMVLVAGIAAAIAVMFLISRAAQSAIEHVSAGVQGSGSLE